MTQAGRSPQTLGLQKGQHFWVTKVCRKPKSAPWCHLESLSLQPFPAPLFSVHSSFLLHPFARGGGAQRRAIQHKVTGTSELTSPHRCNQGTKPQGQHPFPPCNMCQIPKIKPHCQLLPSKHFIHHEVYSKQCCVSPVRANADETSQVSNASGCTFPKQGANKCSFV